MSDQNLRSHLELLFCWECRDVREVGDPKDTQVWSYVKHMPQKRKLIRHSASKDTWVCCYLVIQEAHASKSKVITHILTCLFLTRNIFVAQTHSLEIQKYWIWSSQIVRTYFSFLWPNLPLALMSEGKLYISIHCINRREGVISQC